jgi:hypothetical protein
MAEDQVVPFSSVDWEDDVPGIRAREKVIDGRRWAIVAYEPGAMRQEWCRDGHWGLVLEGAVEFDDGGERLQAGAGEAFFLSTGRGHRGRNLACGETRLFLIDDPE